MRIFTVLSCLFVALALFAMPGQALAGFDLGISIGDDGSRSFRLAVGDFFGVAERSVSVIHKRGLPDDEVPVALFLASRIGVPPLDIVALRLGGKSWMDITLRFGLTPEVFYVKAGPPYGKAYGHYMKKPRGQWKKLRLGDSDVVNLVNLKFLSEHYGMTPTEVIKMREKGKGFVSIHGDVKKAKGKGKSKGSGKSWDKGSKGNGKGKGNKGKKK